MTDQDNENNQNSELECRVCRVGGDEDRPLYTPCKCSGSIGLVHQDCLEAWLNHSKKNTCELCGAKYQFAPQYAENTPSIIPPFIFIRSFLKLTVFKALPFTLRVILAIFIWLILVPLGTTVAYCTCMRRNFNLSWKMSTSTFASTVCYGIVIDAVMALSMLIIMSFADFLRFHWAPVNNNAPNINGQPGMDPVANVQNLPAQNLPPDVQPAPQVPHQPQEIPIQNHNINDDRVNALRQRIRRPVQQQPPQRHTNDHTTRLNARQPNFPTDLNQTFGINRVNHLPPTHPRMAVERNLEDESGVFQIPPQRDSSHSTLSSTPIPNIHSNSADDLFPVSSLDETFRRNQIRRISEESSSLSHPPPRPLEKKYILAETDDMGDDDKEFHRMISREFHDCLTHENDENIRKPSALEDDEDRDFSISDSSYSSSSSDSSGSTNTNELLAGYDQANPNHLNRLDLPQPENNHFFINSDSDSSSSDDDDDEDDGFGAFDLRLEIGLEIDGGVGGGLDLGANNNNNLNNNNAINNNNLNPNNNNNNNNNNNINMGNDAENPDVGIEIRIALFELLGLEGPFYIMFRNAAWLLAFSSVYITVLGFFPYMIGTIVMKLIRAKILAVVIPTLQTNTPAIVFQLLSPLNRFFDHVVDLLAAVSQLSQDKNPPLQFMDLIFVAIGYMTICVVVFSFDFLVSLLKKLQENPQAPAGGGPAGIVQTISVNISQLSLVIKVGLLLVVRIFLLPITLGSAILCILSHHILQYSKDQWIEFLTFNGVGAYALAWVAGITFMLSVTISVLQLREVLHPTIFGKIIKPQEAHSDLIISLIHENGLIHTKRIFVSCCVYALLLGLLIYSPILWYEMMNVYLGWNIFHFHFWYFIPQIQIPIELLLGHILFLSIVDKNKDIIGHIQHYWLVFICKKLELTRFILPLPMIKKKKVGETSGKKQRKKGHRERDEDPLPSSSAPPSPTEATTIGVEGEDYEVGKPLLRPPAGWDIRSSQNSTRWAWGGETPSTLEKNVAPRIAPPYYLLKMFFLLFISFVLLHLVTLFIFIAPLTTGRYLIRILYLPQYLIHDPLCFIVGSYVMITFIVGVYRIIFQSNLISNHLLRFHPCLLSCKYLYYYGEISSWTFFGTVARIWSQRVLNFMIVGMMVHVMSKLWNVDLYYGFFSSTPYSFKTSEAAINIGKVAMSDGSRIGSGGGVAGIIYDFTVFHVPNYFSADCKASLWKDCLHLLSRGSSFVPTGLILVEVFIYVLFSAFGLRLCRYLQSSSTLTWINQCQTSMNHLIFTMKEALAHNYYRYHQNRAHDNTVQQPTPEQPVPATEVDHTHQVDDGARSTNTEQQHQHQQHQQHSYHHIHRSYETKIIQQMYDVYLLVYFPFYREFVLKGFFLFVLLPTLILSNQPVLRLFNLLPLAEWLMKRPTPGDDDFTLMTPLAGSGGGSEQGETDLLFSFRIHWMIMRGLIVGYLVMVLTPFLLHPLYQSFVTLYNKVRDENYLVGRRLLNVQQHQQPPQQEQGTST